MSIRLSVVLVLIARVAAADPTEPSEIKNPDTALALSVGATAVSVGMVALGTQHGSSGDLIAVGVLSSLVTPSLGHWYAGDYFTTGLGIRLISAATFVGGVAEVFASSCWDSPCNENTGGAQTGAVLAIMGMIGYGTGTVLDIATAPKAAREYNARHRLVVTPTLLTPPSGPVMGVGIGGRF